MAKTKTPAIEGWFTSGDEPALVGSRGKETGSYFFPKGVAFSRNPAAPAEELEEVELGRRGRVWSFTTNHYSPPEPYVAPDPFVPYTIVAVELPEEQMVVLGQLADDADPAALKVGAEVELVLGTLYEDDDHEYEVWKWRPV
ncbi:MAG TPA: OB-fold domain-containing protein [Acidimicrobiia bacterium]|nr:OB-fold domain-containing protein [Acidimicrobiia bacterium]